MKEQKGRETARDNDFICESGMKDGTFDNVKMCGYAIPSHWDIGKV